jgi:A/G-specific adenine glycosylase
MTEKWFQKRLQRWYEKNKRDLPWRKETDPYKIWISEIILQQTQVQQGLAYYERFIKKFPSVKNLASAGEDEVLKLWQGLGYYSRARNLHAAAKSVVKEYNGVFPTEYESILKLKGIGTYTASAIASFAFDKPHAVVDGNVYRVLSRLFGIKEAIDSSAGKRVFQQTADELIDKKDPALHNQAIMEFGSQYCKPVAPQCSLCIFSDKCFALAHNLVAQLPIKEKKNRVTERFFSYLLVADKQGKILINKREEKDIWRGLYEFSLLETQALCEPQHLLKKSEIKKVAGNNFDLLHVSDPYKHVLSHQHLHTRFYVIRKRGMHDGSTLSVPPGRLTKYAFPRLIEKFMEDCNLNELL